jgi:hypothetical protein
LQALLIIIWEIARTTYTYSINQSFKLTAGHNDAHTMLVGAIIIFINFVEQHKITIPNMIHLALSIQGNLSLIDYLLLLFEVLMIGVKFPPLVTQVKND